MIPVIYENLCPVCNGELADEEILAGRCLKKGIPISSSYHSEEEKEIERLFEKVIGKPREIQRFWIRRVSSGESFAAVAPTGIGKTAFGLVFSLYLSLKGKKSYVIVPTKLLVKQCIENLERFAGSIGRSLGKNDDGEIRVAFYHGGMRKEEKRSFVRLLESKGFDILVTTTQFLSKNFDLIESVVFDFIFVDDVDAILKGSRNVWRILHLLGFRKVGDRWTGESRGVLMVSTATAKKGKATRLFRELLNFDVGSSFFTVRNIDDVFAGREDIERIKEIMRMMGKGGLIYARTAEDAERYHNLLSSEFNIGIAISKRKNDYERFERGEVDFLIGTASYYGTLVRGLDLPYRIRYVIFIGLPSLKFSYDKVTPSLLRIIALSFKGNEKVREFLPILPKIDRDPESFERLKEVIREVSRKEKSEDLVVDGEKIIFPDVRTYIQGSGRASRLTERGLTKGASFIFESNEELINAFSKRASYYDIEIKNLEEIDIDKLKREIDGSRIRGEYEDAIKPAMLIVESPTKAKLISRFFGRPSIKSYGSIIVYEVPTERYILLVTACLGHIVDLSVERGFHGVETGEDFVPVYASIKRCRSCNYQFTQEGACPRCGSEEVIDSRDRIEDLRRLSSKVSLVIVGTDPDAEGEKIAWDLYNLLSPLADVKRAEFHEVTPRAIRDALSNLRDMDMNRIKAQIVRRIEDRWIGFVLSQKLWKVFHRMNLSAGRVQTPVLDWIIEQDRKYRKRVRKGFIKELGLDVDWDASGDIELDIELVSEDRKKVSPPPPYTTDELLKDAGRILKLSSLDTMKLAQDLFENGLITYHRTDSTRVSDVGLRIAREYLGEDFRGRTWDLKDTGEGAHECIRPTRSWDRYMIQRMIYEKVITPENLTRQHLALYDLIFRRFMSSQCKDFEVLIKRYRIHSDKGSFEEERIVDARGRAFELYHGVFVKRELPVGRIKARIDVRYVPEGYPYTQADIVRLMKERGLGRPSTYATIIGKLFERGYIYERNRFVLPTSLGKKVNWFLKERYSEFVSEERTRILYEKIDEIEKGNLDYMETIRDLYEEIRKI